MALPVLDGNQSATTLSSVVTGGEHIVAHSVVSLGTTAISNISTAVSGVNNAVGLDGASPANNNFIKIGGHQDGQNALEHIVHVSAGGAMKVDASDSAVTFGLASVTFSAVSISNFPATQTIAGTVTANVPLVGTGEAGQVPAVPVYLTRGADGGAVDVVNYVNNLPAISGTVTANVGPSIVGDRGGGSVPINAVAIGHEVVGDGFYNVSSDKPFPISGAISGTVTANVLGNKPFDNSTYDSGNVVPVQIIRSLDGLVLGDENPLSISGTVTVGAMPNGSLTTRFGTPTTANTAFATSAVTNANRKYLLIQNVTTGSNVITVGIGFTPTTTQGIQLTAGAGITFESSYIPTGAVYVLSSVTASNFTILEA